MTATDPTPTHPTERVATPGSLAGVLALGCCDDYTPLAFFVVPGLQLLTRERNYA